MEAGGISGWFLHIIGPISIYKKFPEAKSEVFHPLRH